jgi:hypothetical protein
MMRSFATCTLQHFAMGMAYSTYGKNSAYRILMVKPEGNRRLGRQGWGGDIIVDFREIGSGVLTGILWFGIGTNGGILWTWQ